MHTADTLDKSKRTEAEARYDVALAELRRVTKIFSDADNRWEDELRKQFGKEAGYIRYTPAGKGKPGSTLYDLHEARDAARVAHDAAQTKVRAASAKVGAGYAPTGFADDVCRCAGCRA